MRIAIAGHTGFLGTELCKYLQAKNYKINAIPRSAFANSDALKLIIDSSDVVINLAGSNIGKRWTKQQKQNIYESRILSTRSLATAINKASNKPALFISASGIGIYNTGHFQTEESKDFAIGFLGKVCQEWENEALKVSNPNTRVVILRMAPVLDFKGGILTRLTPLFRFGLGAAMGSGKQPFSWIALNDWLQVVSFIIENTNSQGIYNTLAPTLINNNEFSRLLAAYFRHPLLLRLPSWLVRLMLGENSTLVLEGQTAKPQRLLDQGYTFQYSDMHDFLKIK